MDADEKIKVVDRIFAFEEEDTPFGKRYGQEMVTLDDEHFNALKSGKMLAVDVQGEYVVLLKLEETKA